VKTDKLIALGRTVFLVLSRTLIPFALLIFFAPFVGLMFCASLSSDDFAKATLATPGYVCARQVSFFSAAWPEYTNGSGRWLANLVESAAMTKFNLTASYGWLLLLVMVTNIVALSYFLRNLFQVPRINALFAAGVVYAAWLASFSSPGENIFWVTGAIEYQLSITTLLLIAGVLCKFRQTIYTYIALGVLAIAVPAQHEIAGVFLLACLLGGLIAAQFLKIPIRPWLLSLGLCGISLAAIMLSPGMAIKMAGGHSARGYAAQIVPHARRAIELGVEWVLNPSLLLGVLCIPLLLWGGKDAKDEYRPPRWLALLGIGAICVLLGEFANAEMRSGLPGFYPRVIGWFQFVFCVLLGTVISTGAPEISKIRFSTPSKVGLFALFALSLLASGNFHQAEKDLRGPARSWHRGNVIRLAQSGNQLLLDPLPAKPKMFDETGLSKNTGCWVNQCLAIYLKANEVSLKGPSENHWGGGNPCSDPAPK
jgi:hypothetical protein